MAQAAGAHEGALSAMVKIADLVRAASQQIRADAFASAGTNPHKVWLRSAAELQPLIGGSIVLMRSSSEQPDGATAVVLPRIGSTACARRTNDGLCVRLSTDGRAEGTKFIALSSLATTVRAIAPAVLHAHGVAGSKANITNADGTAVRIDLVASAAAPPAFSVHVGDEEIVSSSADAEAALLTAKVEGVWKTWAAFTHDEGWGLPLSDRMFSAPFQPSTEPWLQFTRMVKDAVNVPPSTANQVIEVVVGLAGLTASEVSIDELASAFMDGPAFQPMCRACLEYSVTRATTNKLEKAQVAPGGGRTNA